MMWFNFGRSLLHYFVLQVKHKLAEGVENANRKLCKVENLKNGG
jgi:hypothetical protein